MKSTLHHQTAGRLQHNSAGGVPPKETLRPKETIHYQETTGSQTAGNEPPKEITLEIEINLKDAVTTPKTILEIMYSKEEKENDIEIWAYHCERRRLSAIEEEEKKNEKEKKYIQQKTQKEAWEKIIRWNNPKNTMKEEKHKPPPLNDDGSGGNSTM